MVFPKDKDGVLKDREREANIPKEILKRREQKKFNKDL